MLQEGHTSGAKQEVGKGGSYMVGTQVPYRHLRQEIYQDCTYLKS